MRTGCPIGTYGVGCQHSCNLGDIECNGTTSEMTGIMKRNHETQAVFVYCMYVGYNICLHYILGEKPKGLPMATIAGPACASILVISGIMGLIIYCIREKNSGDVHKKQNSTDLTCRY